MTLIRLKLREEHLIADGLRTLWEGFVTFILFSLLTVAIVAVTSALGG